MAPYELFLRREAYDFLEGLRRSERERLLGFLGRLADEPHQRGDYQESDAVGRSVEVIVRAGYAILYWADHAVREIKVLGIRSADR